MRKNSLIGEMQAKNQTICEYCGKTKEGISFVIGASREPDWMMVEGTGKMCCPDCWSMAREEGRKAVENHVNQFKR